MVCVNPAIARQGQSRPRFIPYPPIEKLGVIGDRRTAAVVAADGTICFWCLPDFTGRPVFGALLDAHKGGYFRLGPAAALLGEQAYLTDTAVLATRWTGPRGCLESTDLMLYPQTDRDPEQCDRRTILRRLRCVSGVVHCTAALTPRPDFGAPPRIVADGIELDASGQGLAVWSDLPGFDGGASFRRDFELRAGAEIWIAIGLGEKTAEWSANRAHRELDATIDYWRRWSQGLRYRGGRQQRIKQAGLLVHLMCYAPTGAPVAAPTTSLPERLGGSRNFDYRYSWIRDASLSFSLLAELGFTGDEERYLDWLVQLPPGPTMPLQTAYRADSGAEAPPCRRDDLNGYRGSRPVYLGNPALQMYEIGSFGYLGDCLWTYVERNGTWKEEYWRLMRRIADFVAANWRRKDCGIWEIEERDFVTSRVLSWTTLDRAVRIAERVGRTDAPLAVWHREAKAIRAEVLSRGWSAAMNSFRQHYAADTVDAALLLIPLLGFLPADHPKVEGTVTQIEARLMINGFVHRFVEEAFPGEGQNLLGEEEGAFTMCTCWLAHYYAMRGDRERADAILRRVEATAPAGLLSEAIDARSGAQLGNMALLFSQVEYAKAALALEHPEAVDE